MKDVSYNEEYAAYMKEYLKDIPRFHIVNCCVVFSLIKGSIHVLLVEQDHGPSKGTWVLPYGFVMENEDMDNATRRILAAKTGLENTFLEQVRVYGDAKRYPYARVVAMMYYALINIDDYDEQLSERNNAKWFPLSEVPEMLYDQNDMIKAAVRRMRYRTMEKPVGLNMLPPLFTMTQLRSLVEAIEDRLRDKRNFHKLIEELNFIEKTDKIDKTTSKRGAALYRFNQKLYEEFLKQKFELKEKKS